MIYRGYEKLKMFLFEIHKPFKLALLSISIKYRFHASYLRKGDLLGKTSILKKLKFPKFRKGFLGPRFSYENGI